MNKELLEEKAEKYSFQVPYNGTNDFYDRDKYDAFLAGAKEILDNPDKYWNWSMVKLLIEGLKTKIEGLASKEQSEFAIDVYNSHIGDLHTALRVIDRYCDTIELGETYVQKDKYDELGAFQNDLHPEYSTLQVKNKELKEKIQQLETIIAKLSHKIILYESNY